MKPIDTRQRGFVPLHHRGQSPPRVVTRLTSEAQVEKQVVLSTENYLGQGILHSNAPLIPLNSDESNNQNVAPPPPTGSCKICTIYFS